MELDQIVEKFRKNPKYMTNGAGLLSRRWGCTKQNIKDARSIIRSKSINKSFTVHDDKKQFNHSTIGNRILIIGDTHIPYEKKGYLEFCKKQYDLFKCNTVIHIGDLIDSHSTSYHPSIPEAYSPGDELQYTINKLKKWYAAFPKMKVVIGNHDARVNRIASGNNIVKKWLRDYSEVLEVPNWQFEEYYDTKHTLFTHGTGTSGVSAAQKRALNVGKNVVIGHLHTESSIIYHKLYDKTIFGMIVGCGIDEDSYGMNYAKNFPKKSITSCGIIIDDEPLLKIMKN